MVNAMDDPKTKVIDAYQLANKGNFEHARLILEETLYDHPKLIEGWLLMADLAEDAEDARQCYQMILELAPSNWVAQQRMKLLFGQQDTPPAPEANLLDFFEEDEDDLDLSKEEQPEDVDLITSDLLDELTKPAKVKVKPPTLKESYQAHKKLVNRVGAGIIALLVIGVVSWVVTVGFVVWKTGFMAWFGF